MMMKIGPSFSAHGLREGIHWHINPDVSIEYIASTTGSGNDSLGKIHQQENG